MFKEILLAIFIGILTQLILTPIMYALHPSYYPLLINAPFGGIVIFILDNLGFVVFAALALYIWKGLKGQDTQNQYYQGAG